MLTHIMSLPQPTSSLPSPVEKVTSKERKVALVTGSATGIGANIAVDLVAAGYTVVVTGRDTEKLEKVASRCIAVRPISCDPVDVVSIFVADLNNYDQINLLTDFVRLKFNRLDVLVNNACWRSENRNVLEDGAYDDLLKVLHINVSVPAYLVHKCLIPLKPATSTAILVNISSIASQVAVPLHLYSISKACLSEFSRQVALLTQELDILSVTISPGPVITEERPHHSEMSRLTLMKRVGTTQEVSNLVMFAISRALLFNGTELNIDGGYMAKQKL